MKLKKHIPNILSSLRLLSPFVLSPLIIASNFKWAIIALSAFLLTDAMDGYLARKWNVQSDLGAKIDVVADKIILLSLLIPLLILNPMFIITLLMEGAISSINVIRKIKGGNPKTLQIGRLKMILISLFMGVSYLNILTMISPSIISTLFSITTVLQILTSKSYYDELKEEERIRKIDSDIKKMEELVRTKLKDSDSELELNRDNNKETMLKHKNELMNIRDELLNNRVVKNIPKSKKLVKKNNNN